MTAPSRWTVLVRACLLLLGWGVALLGLSTVFARGPWQGWAMAVAACALLVAALLRVARPGARLVPCLVGLLAGAVPAVGSIADAVEAVLRRVDEGERLKAAVAGVAEASGLGKSELYDAAVAARKGRS